MVTYLAVYTESKNDSPAFSIWDTYQQALNAEVPEGMILWDVIGIKDADRAKHQQNPAFIPAKEFPANRYDAEGVVYTGDYQTNDNYNPYKYVNEAPFGAEDNDPWEWYKEDTMVRVEPLNMRGASGMLMVVIGIMLWQA